MNMTISIISITSMLITCVLIQFYTNDILIGLWLASLCMFIVGLSVERN